MKGIPSPDLSFSACECECGSICVCENGCVCVGSHVLFASIGIICWLTHAHTHKLHTPKHINKFHLHTHSSPTYTLTFSLTHTLSCTHTTSARVTQQCLAEFVSSVLILTLFFNGVPLLLLLPPESLSFISFPTSFCFIRQFVAAC